MKNTHTKKNFAVGSKWKDLYGLGDKMIIIQREGK